MSREQIELPETHSNSSRVYTLLLLTSIYGVSVIDRQIIGLFLEDVRAEFRVSDVTLGFISGFGFAGLYVLSSVIISRWAESGPRRAIIAGGLLAYSIMTSLAALSQTVMQLVITRLGVGIGEGTTIGPATSVISDLFPPSERTFPMSVFTSGAYLATFIAFPVAGWINQHYGWRAALIAGGAPGLILAILFYLTSKDPSRGAVESRTDLRSWSFVSTLRFLLTQRSICLLFIGGIGNGIALYSFAAWIPTFLSRVHMMSRLEIGLTSGTCFGLAGFAGALCGGFVGNLFGRKGAALRLLGPAVISMLALPTSVVFLLAQSKAVTLAGLFTTVFLLTFPHGPIWSALHAAVKVRMRATTTAVAQLFITLIGLGAGPLIVGFLNDQLRAHFGLASIRYSLLLPCIAAFAGGAIIATASRYIVGDAAIAESNA